MNFALWILLSVKIINNIFSLFRSSYFTHFVSSSVPIRQVSVGTQQTWNVGAKHMAKTSSPRRSPRPSWSLCGRPYRTSHSSSWRPLPSSLSASLFTNHRERKVNVRTGARGMGFGGGTSILDKEQSRNMEKKKGCRGTSIESWKWVRGASLGNGRRPKQGIKTGWQKLCSKLLP